MLSEIFRVICYIGENNIFIGILTLFLLFLAPFMIKNTIRIIRNKKFSNLTFKFILSIVAYFLLLLFSIFYLINYSKFDYIFQEPSKENEYINSNIEHIESTDKIEKNPIDYNYYKNRLEFYLEALEKEGNSQYADDYRRVIQYYLDALEKEENSELANNYERIIQYYLELLSREENSKIEESDLREIRDQINDLTLKIIDINEKIDDLNSAIEQSNNKDIISSCITGICTILAAFIAAKSVTTVVIKYKNRNIIRK